MTGLKRYYVKCVKCGYEWMAHSASPNRCALCNNKHIDRPKLRHHLYEDLDDKTQSAKCQ